MLLPAGSYSFSFRLKCSDNTRPEPIATLEVSALRGEQEVQLASRCLLATDFREANAWQVFSLVADVLEGDDVKARVLFHPGVADLWCDWIGIQPIGQVSHEQLELPLGFWRDRLIEPIWAKGRARIGPLTISGAGTTLRPLALRAPCPLEVQVRDGFRLRLEEGQARLYSPSQQGELLVGPGGLRLEVGSRRLVLSPDSIKLERYDDGLGAWVEQASSDLIESWRDGERAGKIALTALGRYPLGPEDISVPGLDDEGKLRLSQVGEKAGSLSELALERSWEADKLLLESEVFADPSSLRLRGGICDYSGRKLTDLVSSSNEISAEGLIRPGAITAEKLADGIDASTKGLRAADADTLDGYHVHELTLDLILEHGNRTEHDIEFSSATAGPVLLDRTTGEKWRLYVEDGILRLEKIS